MCKALNLECGGPGFDSWPVHQKAAASHDVVLRMVASVVDVIWVKLLRLGLEAKESHNLT